MISCLLAAWHERQSEPQNEECRTRTDGAGRSYRHAMFEEEEKNGGHRIRKARAEMGYSKYVW